ncbi:bis(5'-nucleosyl)-tetraphosphatase (symmetrical) YqeK [Carnobacterium viridans]|uniref:bis(5'-nucleosyl)-tetraphosphatase (symmetrical) n=1 Tax=Carnobacterium viridans TaxID=174587 RepID=A0A1H1BKN9_9LACT|nr:bis(5'-nucleosyl)-tetraphosphatase (symmetrical) YqeK [Carnobacterium viridans]UDE95765.1 bis(5'-nucleosyl)-tetraphosphatase (symmetrical) YqeK [Carnobacterium viridans]SDQ51946.1 putative HD superfamily hydrolase of NAD metabolism [Carnobacterium viridans]
MEDKMNQLRYSNNYTTLTRNELIQAVQSQMSQKRFQHVLGVEQTAVELAEKYGASNEAASIAALTHDYAKERSDKEMQELIYREQFDLELLEYGSNIWHGPLGAFLVEQELGISDSDILNAIKYHTIGAPEMTILEQVIYVADYIEPGRNFPSVEKARKIAAENLQAAVQYETKQTLQHLIEKNRKIYPKTIATYNKWVANP